MSKSYATSDKSYFFVLTEHLSDDVDLPEDIPEDADYDILPQVENHLPVILVGLQPNARFQNWQMAWVTCLT